MLLGGPYSQRGGNSGDGRRAARLPPLKPSRWHSPSSYTGGVTLFDCAGDARALARYKPPPGYGAPPPGRG